MKKIHGPSTSTLYTLNAKEITSVLQLFYNKSGLLPDKRRTKKKKKKERQKAKRSWQVLCNANFKLSVLINNPVQIKMRFSFPWKEKQMTLVLKQKLSEHLKHANCWRSQFRQHIEFWTARVFYWTYPSSRTLKNFFRVLEICNGKNRQGKILQKTESSITLPQLELQVKQAIKTHGV